MRFSHKEYRRAAYDPHAGRPVDMMVASNKSSLPAGLSGVELKLVRSGSYLQGIVLGENEKTKLKCLEGRKCRV